VIRNLGTPTEQSWPGVGNLPDYSKITFPDTSGIPYTDMVPEATPGAVDLLSNLVIYDSNKRLPAKNALKHHFFHELPFPARFQGSSGKFLILFGQGGRDAEACREKAGLAKQRLPHRRSLSQAL